MGNLHNEPVDFNKFIVGYQNGIASRLKRLIEYYNNMFLNKDFVSSIIQSRKAGIRPSIHIETELVNKFKSKGFGKFIDSHKPIPGDVFDKSLLKAKSNFNKEKPQLPKDKSRWLKALKLALEKCGFPKKKFKPSSLLFASVHLTRSSSSGFGYMGNKGANFDLIFANAKRFLSGEWNVGRMLVTPLVCGFRLQLRKVVENTVFKCRIIYMYSGHMTLLELMFALPFLIHFTKTVGNNTFYTIGKNGARISKLLKNRLKIKRFKRMISLDISSWDQNLPNWLIIAAFGLLREQLVLSLLQERIFNTLVSYFMTSLVLHTVGGKNELYLKYSGLPSGSVFTNLIGTLCHLILLCYLDPNSVHSDAFILCSDDNIFCTCKDPSVLIKQYLDIFGLVVDVGKTDIYTSLHKFEFLGFTWINFRRFSDIKLVVNQCIWHSTFNTKLDIYERHVARCASVLLNSWNTIPIFKTLFPELIQAINEGKDIRFTYMNLYSPASLLEGLNILKTKTSAVLRNESLRQHILYGPLIR